MKNRWMKKVVAIAAAVVLAVSPAFVQGIPGFAVTEARAAASKLDVTLHVTYDQTGARSMLDYINKFRAGNDVDGQKADYWNEDDATKTDLTGTLSPITYDYELEKVAMQRAAEIAVSFAHERPNGSDCFTAWHESGDWTQGNWMTVGENIAAGYGTMDDAYQAFKDWREDEKSYVGQGHRRNMLNPGFNRIGIGHVVFRGVHYWTQAFGGGSGNGVGETKACNEEKDVLVEVSTDNVQSFAATASPESYALKVGEKEELPTAKLTMLLKETFPEKTFSVRASADWTSGDPAVAAIEDGKVVAKAAGKTSLKATVNETALEVPIEVTTEESGAGEERIPGDVNDDGQVNGKDLIRLKQHMAGYDVTINESNADVTGDGAVTGKDVIRLCQYFAGYLVELA